MSDAPGGIVAASPRRRPLGPRAKLSLRAAVNGKCRECICDPRAHAGTWRQQVASCTARACPLFPVRPMPTSGCGQPREAATGGAS